MAKDPATKNAVKANPNGASGGADGEKKKPTPPKREKFRKDGDAKLDHIPVEWSPGKHLPLSKDDFTEEALFYDFKQHRLQLSADKMGQMAAECRAGGTPEQRKARQKFLQQAKSFQEMQKKLIEQMGEGAVAELLARANQTAPVAPATEAAPAA